MQEIARLFLLPLVVLVVDLGGTFGTDKYAPENLSSPTAKEIMVNLEQYVIDLDNSFNVIVSQLKKHNNVVKAVRKYQNTYEDAKVATCKVDRRSANEDTDLIATYIDNCVESLSVDLAKLNSKVVVAKFKVKSLDDSLKRNQVKCSQGPSKKSPAYKKSQVYAAFSCEEDRTKLLRSLNNILSAEKKEEFQMFAKIVLANAQKNLNSCFSDKSEDLLRDLKKATSKIKDCVSSKAEE